MIDVYATRRPQCARRTADVVIRGHAFVQNLRRDRYEIAIDTEPMPRLATAFDELRPAI